MLDYHMEEEVNRGIKTIERNRLGGIAAILIGLLNIVLVIYVVVTPAASRFDAGEFFRYFAEDPLSLSIAWIVFAVTAVLSYAVIPAVGDLVEGLNRNWERSATFYGIVGYTVLGVWAITLARTVPELAQNYVSGDEMTRIAILAQGLPEIDPDGWFTFGGPGTWLIVMNILALCGGRLSKMHGIVGILLGFSHWATVFAALFEFEPLNLIASAGGALFYPVWFIWLGFLFLRGRSPDDLGGE
jgi:hypothetical protein